MLLSVCLKNAQSGLANPDLLVSMVSIRGFDTLRTQPKPSFLLNPAPLRTQGFDTSLLNPTPKGFANPTHLRSTDYRKIKPLIIGIGLYKNLVLSDFTQLYANSDEVL